MESGVVSSEVRELCKAVSQEDSERVNLLLDELLRVLDEPQRCSNRQLSFQAVPELMILALIDEIRRRPSRAATGESFPRTQGRTSRVFPCRLKSFPEP